MKKITLRLGIVVSITLFMAGCSGGPRSVAPVSKAESLSTIQFETYSDQGMILYDEQNPEGPRMSFTFSLLDVIGSTQSAGSLTTLIQNLVYDGHAPDAYKDALIASYKNNYVQMERVPDENSGTMLNWEYTETVEGDQLGSRLIVISRSREYYLGGAHGMREKAYFVIDGEQVKQLKIEDFIQDKPALERFIEDALRSYTELEPGAPLSGGGFFEDTIPIPDNFFLSSEGIGFHWDPYEIAPYVMGSIEVVLPFAEIKALLLHTPLLDF
ncbi:MAG: DUF3298 domain-containing protein [Treponema sp.]|jgi:hypothetical protein|nr:DUF3298 domain-containing protein [Treponema sp.]